MDADQQFETFLREWTNERIWPMRDLLDSRDRQYIVERRATELMQAAKEKGFADNLTKTMAGYGDATAYVNHLFWEAEFKDEPG
jgi:hypothetical protein